MFLISFIARYWPFANGSGRILDKWGGNVDAGIGEREATTSDGFSMRVFADDLIGRHLLLSGKFDRSIVQVLLDQGSDDDVLLDVGANIGYVSACFLSGAPGRKVVCVEPQPRIVDLLRKNMAQFGERAQVHQVALSDRDGELRFHVDVKNRGASRISDVGEVKVEAVEAANFLESIGKCDLIKIDVEGHEEAVFRGMAANLRRLSPPPRAILFENHEAAASPEGPIGSILSAAGYRIYGIKKRLTSTKLVLIRSAADCRYNDYLALHGDK